MRASLMARRRQGRRYRHRLALCGLRTDLAWRLSLGEADARIGVSRVELEAMITAGKIEAVTAGFTWMIPTREVERMKAGMSQIGRHL